MMKKLDIIYRCCNAEVEPDDTRYYRFFNMDAPAPLRPPWFSKIKCLNSFLKSVELNKSFINKVIFVHDGPKGKLFDSIPKNYETICVNYKSNENSLLETFKIADKLHEDVYFVEDDYIHLPDSVKIIAQGVKTFKLVTGYDHPDRYKRDDDITMGKEYIAYSQKTKCHWRTVESTCCTWATTREMWDKHVGDFAKTYRLEDRQLFRNLYNEHKIRLWNPIPGIISQIDVMNVSFGVDWEAQALLN
jgi:hypothetical protein